MSWHTFLPTLLNMSVTASVVILVVLFARLLLKKAPKMFSYMLWYVVLFRLLCPVAISSPLSLLGVLDAPVNEARSVASSMEYIPGSIVHTQFQEIHMPVVGADDAGGRQQFQAPEQAGAAPVELSASFVPYIWGTGFLVMAGYSVISYLAVRRKLRVVIPLWDNIFLADDIRSPFVIGFFRPRIYLPCGLGDKEQEYIILHERHHIRRFDHIVKALAFMALCIHWFNPLVWLAFSLFGKDMEMSCDEAVIRKLGEDVRADYSASLLALATGRRIIAGTPLAFGEGDTKGRIRNLANWRKPGFWMILTAVAGCVALAVCLLTNPMNSDSQKEKEDEARLVAETSESGGGVEEAERFSQGAGDGKGAESFSQGGDDEKEMEGLPQGSGDNEPESTMVAKQLTIEDVVTLSKKGDDLSWEDFEQYPYENIGSGLYIQRHKIDEIFSLLVGGGSFESKPMYVYLQASLGSQSETGSSEKTAQSGDVDQQVNDSHERIDIRYEDVWAFVQRIWYENSAVVTAQADLDHDGETEKVVVRTVTPGQVYELAVEKEDGTQIWASEASPAHVGWNTIMLCSEGGQDYLVQYLPTMFQGFGSYTCTMFSLEGGKETVKERWSVDFELPAEGPLELTLEMTRFSEEIGGLLEKSVVLLSTEQGVLVEGPEAATALPQLYPVRFDPEEIQAAMNAAEEGELSPDAAAYPDEPLEMLFFSGAGAWGTTLTLQPDGTFTGEYYDHDMGDNKLMYPHGTVYICRFSGRFSEPTQISDYAFSMYLEELTTEQPVGKEWIEDAMRFTACDPIGMIDGEEFILYAPGTPVDELSGEFRDTWWPGAWRWRSGELSQLNCWGLCNVNTEEGFFEYAY